MKKQAFRILGVLSLYVGMAASSLYAQSHAPFTVKVPFDFTISRKTFPAGNYEVRTVPNHDNVLLIHTPDRRSGAFILTNRVQSLEVFHRYAEHCFLAQIWFGFESLGRALPESKNEMDLARGNANPEMTVLVAFPPTRVD